MPGGDVSGATAAVARLQALAQFAGEKIRRGVAVAELENDEAALAPLRSPFEGRRHIARVVLVG
jgi:hypothetical protein